MLWHWQQSGWPDFTWDTKALENAEHIFAEDRGVMTGLGYHLSRQDISDVTIALMCQEALDTSSIEGETLDRESVQSSLKKNLGLKHDQYRQSKPAEAGIAEMMLDIYHNPKQNLSHQTLYRWHHMLMNGRRDIASIGCYRQHQEPMQIVSGGIDYAQKIHYEAPPSVRVWSEMETFIKWFNESSLNGVKPLPCITRSALAHLWFEAIHPFEDGNGRIGRALSEKSLSQYQTTPMVTGLATVMLQRKKEYYTALKQTNKTLDITEWMLLFASMAIEAQRRTHSVINLTIEKSKLMQKLSGIINQRQEKVLLRMFAEGIDGFKGGLSASNYTRITQAPPATVTRDLNDLVEKGALHKIGERKSTRYHLAIHNLSVAPVTIESIQ